MTNSNAGTTRTTRTRNTNNSSLQTNPTLDSQATFDLLQTTILNQVNQQVDAAIEALHPETEEKITALVEQAKGDVVDEINKSKIELREVKNSVLGSIAIFAAFFTFVSVNVSIFQKTNAFESLAVMIVMWMCLVGFSYSFFIFIWDKGREWKYWIPVILGIVFTCVILFSIKPNATQTLPTPTTESGNNNAAAMSK